jgi:glycosyltransferase involved in cell wall biosynthesis
MGKPVFAYQSGAMPEIVTTKTGVLSKPRDTLEMANNIVKYLPDLKASDCIARAQEFDIARTCKGFQKIINEKLEQRE